MIFRSTTLVSVLVALAYASQSSSSSDNSSSMGPKPRRSAESSIAAQPAALAMQPYRETNPQTVSSDDESAVNIETPEQSPLSQMNSMNQAISNVSANALHFQFPSSFQLPEGMTPEIMNYITMLHVQLLANMQHQTNGSNNILPLMHGASLEMPRFPPLNSFQTGTLTSGDAGNEFKPRSARKPIVLRKLEDAPALDNSDALPQRLASKKRDRSSSSSSSSSSDTSSDSSSSCEEDTNFAHGIVFGRKLMRIELALRTNDERDAFEVVKDAICIFKRLKHTEVLLGETTKKFKRNTLKRRIKRLTAMAARKIERVREVFETNQDKVDNILDYIARMIDVSYSRVHAAASRLERDE